MDGRDKYISVKEIGVISDYLDDIDRYYVNKYKNSDRLDLFISSFPVALYYILIFFIYVAFSNNLLSVFGAISLTVLWLVGHVNYVRGIYKKYNAGKIPTDDIREIILKSD